MTWRLSTLLVIVTTASAQHPRTFKVGPGTSQAL